MDDVAEPPRRRYGCLWPAAVAVLVVALVVGGAVGYDAVRTRQRTDRVQAEVDAAYAAVRPAAERRRQAGDEALSRVLGPARLRSSVLQCSVDEEYAGFNVENWTQFCVLLTVDAYRSDDPVPVLWSKLQRASAGAGSSPALLGCRRAASTRRTPRASARTATRRSSSTTCSRTASSRPTTRRTSTPTTPG